MDKKMETTRMGYILGHYIADTLILLTVIISMSNIIHMMNTIIVITVIYRT